MLSAHEELQILLQLGSPTAQTLLTVITFSSIVPSLKMVNITLLFIKMAYLFKIINIQSGHYACMKFNTQIDLMWLYTWLILKPSRSLENCVRGR